MAEKPVDQFFLAEFPSCEIEKDSGGLGVRDIETQIKLGEPPIGLRLEPCFELGETRIEIIPCKQGIYIVNERCFHRFSLGFGLLSGCALGLVADE